MKKKILALTLASAMALSLAACGSKPAPASGSAGSASAQPEGKTTYTVGICQLAPHPALDAATQGFKDALTEALGDGVQFEEGNAGGEANNCITIVDGFVAAKVDLILGNATPAFTTAASATGDIPVLGTAVTNYAVALGLDDPATTVLGGNLSGTSDLAPLDQQADMIQELFPDAKTVGLLYCSAEANSVYQVDTIQGHLEGMGYNCKAFAFTDVNDLAAVTQSACDQSDVLYIPTDNTAANNTEAIANVVIPAGVPVVTGESGLCTGCGVATLSISYYELGRITGEMAVKILKGEADVATMEIGYDTKLSKLYNEDNCNALGITVPAGYTAIEG